MAEERGARAAEDAPLAVLLHESDRMRVHALDVGVVRLDGGAMFGVVPRPLWERRIPPDGRNRIPLAMRCLLVRADDTIVLVDTGIGDKEDEKFREIYGIENEGSPTRLHEALRAAGAAAEQVDRVVLTHLHFDHAGGATSRDGVGGLGPTFPRARYLVRRPEWDFAHRDNERIRASYLLHNLDPLEDAGAVDFVTGDVEVVPGVRTLHTPGHTPHHQSVLVEDGDTTLCYLADLVPTTAHVRLPWIMGYDLEPLVTLETKRRLLGRAGREGWRLVFEHDPRVAAARAVPRGDGKDGCETAEEVAHRVRGVEVEPSR